MNMKEDYEIKEKMEETEGKEGTEGKKEMKENEETKGSDGMVRKKRSAGMGKWNRRNNTLWEISCRFFPNLGHQGLQKLENSHEK